MTNAAARKPIPFSFKAFGLGFGACGLLYGAAIAVLWANAPATQTRNDSRLASQTVVIERDAYHPKFGPPAPAPVKQQDVPPVTATETPPAAADSHATEIITDHSAGDNATPDTHEAATEHHEEKTAPSATTPDDHHAAVEDHSTPATTTAVKLPAAPIDGLYEVTPDGPLPIVRTADKVRPFDAYRRPFTAIQGSHIVSVIVVDLGLSDVRSTEALAELPDDVSVAVNPYAAKPDVWMNKAREAGHEPWMFLPVETDMYPMNDPGPQTLLISAAGKQNLNKLTWVLSRAQGYAGVVTGESPAFLKSANDVHPVFSDIYKRGLGFVDGDINAAPIPLSIASGFNAPYASATVWIDSPATQEHISASLRQLEVLAQSGQPAIGFVRSSPLTLRLLKGWAETLPQKKITLAPLSAQALR